MNLPRGSLAGGEQRSHSWPVSRGPNAAAKFRSGHHHGGMEDQAELDDGLGAAESHQLIPYLDRWYAARAHSRNGRRSRRIEEPLRLSFAAKGVAAVSEEAA